MNDKNIIFRKPYFNIIQENIDKLYTSDNKGKPEFIRIIESFVDKNNFVELAIRKYTDTNYFVYILNSTMRNFSKGLISLSYFIGPFLFALNKYVKENAKNYNFSEDMILYRNITVSLFDFYLYQMNLNHIICFPTFTSTSLNRREFFYPQNFNKVHNKLINIIIIFRYRHEKDNISPGIIIKDNKASDGRYISSSENEKEVILFPFTFARITNINKKKNMRYI